jgi:hypothetical protein
MKKIILTFLFGTLTLFVLVAMNLSIGESEGQEIHQASNSGTFTWTEHKIDYITHATGIYTCDVDSDGDDDVVASSSSESKIAWWENEGGSPIVWTELSIDDNFNYAIDVYASDLDGDGDPDIIGAAWAGNQIAWWENEGGSPIVWSKHIIKSNYRDAHEVYAFDVDADGDLDVLGASAGLNEITWWRNEGGTPISWAEQKISSNFGGARSVYAKDIDGDGDNDVIGAALTTNEITWWQNEGGNPISWSESVITNDFRGSHHVYVNDLDDDGDFDILGAAYFSDEIAWWRNDGGTPIVWTKQIVDDSFNGAMKVCVEDIDDDGDKDIIGSSSLSNQIAWWRNDGGTPIVWTKQTIDNYCTRAWPFSISDIDKDGDLDVVGGSEEADGIMWYENHLYPQPNKPSIEGPTSGRSGEEYIYKGLSTDPAGVQLYYMFEWGDGSTSDWIGPYNSGEECTKGHVWAEIGNYEIKVKAKNIFDAESIWSNPLPITIPKTYNTPLLTLIERLFNILEKLFIGESMPDTLNS